MALTFFIILIFGSIMFVQKKYYYHAHTEMLTITGSIVAMFNIIYTPQILSVWTAYMMFIIAIGSVGYLYYFSRYTKPEIKAEQVSFWNVPPQGLIENNKHRIEKKKGRNEYVAPPKETFVEETTTRFKKLSPYIFTEIKLYDGFTIVQSLIFFNSDECPLLYKTVFNRLKDISESVEQYIDYEQTLIDNKYCVEFFLIDIWERLCTSEIIGAGTLEYYATNTTEFELVGALDASINSNITKRGICLYAHYLNHKGLFKI